MTSPDETSAGTAHGLTVRWSLVDAEPGTLARLRDYVADTSHATFGSLDGLRFKTWRAREGQWFEGTYVFASPADRQRFQADFTQRAATAPGSQLIGSAPVIEECEIVAVAEGPAGFLAAPRYDT